MNKKAQSEMVGFGVIIIMVAVILLIFLSISFKKSNDEFIKSYEVESFVQSVLSYTTTCEMGYSSNYRDLGELMTDCVQKRTCLDGREACVVLNKTLGGILNQSWKVGGYYPERGYVMNITSKGKTLINFEKGNKTKISKGSLQSLNNGLNIKFIVYD